MGIVDEHCLLNRFPDELVKLRLGGGGVDMEGGMTPVFAVVDVDGDLLVGVVGVAHRLQRTLDEEELIALGALHIDLVAAQLSVSVQVRNHGIHPSFALAFTLGPPSLTRTHSL